MAKFVLTAAHIATLTAIAGATSTFYISAADGGDLAKNGFITVDTNDKDANGNAAAALTDLGRENVPATGKGKDAEPELTFFMTENITPPAVKRGGGGNTSERESKYPFKTIPVGSGVFMPQPGADAEAVKKLSKQVGSVVASFNGKNADRYVTMRSLEDGKVAGFVGRNADGTPNPEAFAGVPGIGIYSRPVSEKPAPRKRTPKTAPATENAEGAEAGETQTA